MMVGLLGIATVGPPLLRIGHFSAQSPSQHLPEGWEQVRFGENESSTAYDLIRDDSTVVVRARSHNGASGLVTHRQVDLTQYPILEWRWRVESIPGGADVTTDTTDDAAARIYVNFDYEGLGVFDRVKLALLRQFGYSDAPSRALNYLWATRLGENESRESPYTDQIRMIAVFGGEPPPVEGIAIMTDTDNTGERARAYYGDIVFRSTRSRQEDSDTLPAGSE